VCLKEQDDGIVVGAARHWLVRQTGSLNLSGHILWRSKVPMSPQPPESRVEILEDRVTRLEALPARIDSMELQIVQLRNEMHGEFSAVRAGMRDLKDGLRQEMRDVKEALRQEMRDVKEALRQEMRDVNEALRQEMHQLNDETRRHMLVLHEEVIGRIALLHEGLLGGQRRPPRKRKR
jgi:gas vesicle protein